jgi:hypothetical protein
VHSLVSIMVVVNEMNSHTEAGKKLIDLNTELKTLQAERWGPGEIGGERMYIRTEVFVPAAKALSGAYEEGIAGVLTIIKASLLGSALMLLESCTGYLTSYQTPCREGHICECVQYTTVYRSWLDCRDYGPPVRDARPIGSK